MDTAKKPIVATTMLSFLLHGVVFAALLLVYGQITTSDEGVGRGVEIHLVSSVLVSDQQEADVPRKQKSIQDASSENMDHAAQRKYTKNVLASLKSTQSIVIPQPVERSIFDKYRAEQQIDSRQKQLNTPESESLASTVQSTNASQQRHAILELLHRRISDNKEYPYLARRQRREGIATVAFVLNPDGTVENAHLVTSSRAVTLDRAAISAVKHIEPFPAAQQYLEQSEKFQVDVEFDLL